MVSVMATSNKRTTFFVFLVIICRVSSCVSRFDDLPSKTVLAPVVFEGKAQHSHSWKVESGTGKGQYYNFTFSVDTVFKGSLPRKDSGKGYRSIVVGVFGDKEVRTRCVSPKVEIGLSYIVFLNSTIHGRAKRLNIYRITSFPQVASNETVETVKSYSCSKCGRRPSSQILLRGKTNGTIGKKLNVQCKVRGKPFPQINWAKDGRPLVPKKGLRIKPNSQGSNLEIRELKQEDSGLYECQAVNALGSSNWSRIQIKAMYESHSIPCSEQNYCLNDGVCFILQSLSRRYCKCKEPFEGPRCMEKRFGLESSNGGPEDGRPFEIGFMMPIIGVVLVVVIVICIVILSFCAISNLWRQRQAKKTKENLENSYQAYSFGIHEGSLRDNHSGRRTSNSGAPFLKDDFTQTERSPLPSRQFAIVRPDSSKAVLLQSDQTRKGSTGSGKASSSLRRARLNGCSITPPDLAQHRRKVHSPILESISVSSRTDAVEASPRSRILPPVGGTFQYEDSNRNSEYDNCWLDEPPRDVRSKDSRARIDKTCNQATSTASVQKSRT